jgi:hypothetical protein
VITKKHKLLKLSLAISACFSLNCPAADDDPLGRDALFGDDIKPVATSPSGSGGGVKGFVQFEGARTTSSPDHWSKLRTRADLNSNGKLGEGLKWKLGVRLDYDFVYGINDFYNSAVEQNQRFDVALRENYLDYSAGNWDFRLGKQHVVWGEMVGLFFADVVSARDLREFILPDGAPGTSHVPGPSQTDRDHQQVELLRDFHKPDPYEDRCNVRKPGDHYRRECTQVLRIGQNGYPENCGTEEG